MAVVYRTDARPTAVYRCYDRSGRLLYVGSSLNPLMRLDEHQRLKPWGTEIANVTITWHPNRQAGEEAEKQAIQDENPKHNIHRRKPGQRKDLEQQRRAEQKLAAQRALRARETAEWREAQRLKLAEQEKEEA